GAARVVVTPGAGERWSVEVTGGRTRRAVLTLTAARLARLADLVGELPVKVSAGIADGALHADIAESGTMRVEGQATLREVAFADAAGSRAGEGIGGEIALQARADRDAWHWHVDAAWRAGEIYWAPVYSKAGYRLVADGALTPGVMEVEQAILSADDLGEMRAGASWDRAGARRGRVRGGNPLPLTPAPRALLC